MPLGKWFDVFRSKPAVPESKNVQAFYFNLGLQVKYQLVERLAPFYISCTKFNFMQPDVHTDYFFSGSPTAIAIEAKNKTNTIMMMMTNSKSSLVAIPRIVRANLYNV